MDDREQKIWQEKMQKNFCDSTSVIDFITFTMDNFYYRYIETARDQNLKTMPLGENIIGASAKEYSFREALKVSDTNAKQGITKLAKTIPMKENPHIIYRLECQLKEVEVNKGSLLLKAIINWDYPHFVDQKKKVEKEKLFTYQELQELRKNFPLALEEICEIFL